MENSLELFQNQFSQSDFIHLNNAGLAPITKISSDRVKYWADRFFQEGFYTDHDYMLDVKTCRGELAQFIQAQSEEIAFFQSTSGAISQIAFEFGFKQGDEILLWSCEYSSNLYPWNEVCRRSGARLVMVDPEPGYLTPLDKLLSQVSDQTRLIAVSWAQFQTGSYTDISELGKFCRTRGIFLIVDVMQALGLKKFKMKDWGVDAVVGGSHKWLVSPVGVGFLALDSKHIARFRSHNVGSGTFGSCDDPAALDCAPKFDASKFESGSKQVLEITALGANLKFLNSIRVSEIEKEALRLAQNITDSILEMGGSVFTGEKSDHPIVNFSLEAQSVSNREVTKMLIEMKCNFALRGPGVRISPHAFNTDHQIEKVLSGLQKLIP